MSILAAQSAAAQPAIEFHAPTLGSVIAIIVAVAGLIFSAFNSGSEIAYFSLSNEDIDGIASDAKRQRVRSLLSKPERLLATILIGNNLVNIMIAVVLNYALNQMMTFNSSVANFLVQTVILTFLILLFGEVTPKLYATNRNVGWAQMASGTLTLLTKVFAPLSKLMLKSTFLVRKTVSSRTDDLSVEDLSKALEASELKSTDEKEMLQGILTFGDKTVSEIMKPRVDVVDLDIEDDFDTVLASVVKNGYSRMPVFQDSPDNIKGVLYAKDLLPYVGSHGPEFKWQRLMRQAYFVPETRMIDDLLEDFRTKKIHMAIVVDEYGCTQGIATLEDVLEEIVGDIDDEYDTEEKFFTRVSADTYNFDGKTSLSDFFEVTGTSDEEFGDAAENAETLAGLLLNAKGDFLSEKEQLDLGRCHFTVLRVKHYRISKVQVKIDPKNDNPKD